MQDVLKFAYEYRNPQGLGIVIGRSGLTKEESRNLLESNVDAFDGYKGKQYNVFKRDYQMLDEWLDWFFGNYSRYGKRR